MPASNSTDRWYNMWFTWMMAAKIWMENDPVADPFRMAEEQTATILHLPVSEQRTNVLPSDRKLVA